MRVLFICGRGKIEKAVDSLKQRLKGAIDLDTLGSLNEIDSYFSRGYTYDKCVILSPDRLIPDYTPSLLEGEMLRFKKTISAKSMRADIIMCVTNEADGLQLVDLFSDMLGELTIIQVGTQLKITDLHELIISQGSTLSKKYPTYDLTTIAKNTARDILDDYNNNQKSQNYKSLDELVKENDASGQREEIITPVGNGIESDFPDSGDSGDDFIINPNGFDPGFVTGFENKDDKTPSYGGSSNMFDDILDNKKSETDFFSNKDPEDKFDFKLPTENKEIFDDSKKSNPFDIKPNKNPFDVKPNTNFDTGTMFNNGSDSNGGNSGVDSSIDMFDGDDIDTGSINSGGMNSDIDYGDDIDTGSIDDYEEPEIRKPDSTTQNNKQRTSLIGSGKKNTPAFAKSDENKKQKEEKKSFFGFGGKKSDTPKNNKNQEVEYELKNTSNTDNSTQFNGYTNDELEPYSDDPAVSTKEVSGKKNIGLNTIKNGKEKPIKNGDNKPNKGLFGINKKEKEPVKVNNEKVQQNNNNNNNIVLDADEDDMYTSPIKSSPVQMGMTSGGIVDTESLFDDNSNKEEIERGSGKGLQPTDLGNARGKVGKSKNSELEELLSPYLKRGALFVVTGSPNAGKTVVSANLANLLCRYGYRVCLLDLAFKTKGQSYLNLDTFRVVHGSYNLKMNSVNVVKSTGTDFAKWTDVVKSGFHVITTTLNSDVDETRDLIFDEKGKSSEDSLSLGRLVRQLTAAYNFVIVDVDFLDLVKYFKDFADQADIILSVEEATQKGLTNFMLNMVNIPDEDMTSIMFNRVSLVLNKEDGIKSLFGKKVNDTRDVLEILDDTVTVLANCMLDYSFTDIPVVSILKYSNVYEKFWFTNKYITDTKDGDRIFTEMLTNALNNL